jgi:hypothetical protein
MNSGLRLKAETCTTGKDTKVIEIIDGDGKK